MSFIESSYKTLVGAVLRKLNLEQPARLTLEDVRRLDGAFLRRLGRQVGLEADADRSTDELAQQIWQALHAGDELSDADDPDPRPSTEPRPTARIPWSYGEDRVTAVPVDPERLFVYWEVTDDAIARARKDLGAGGDDAWLSLRIYDTTGRLFDGTNAHGYFDHQLGREDRQWFFHLDRPSSEAFVEVGMKSREGYFVKIARSGRVAFPRRGTVDATGPSWLTVRTSSGGFETVPRPDPAPAGRAYPVSHEGGAEQSEPRETASSDGGESGAPVEAGPHTVHFTRTGGWERKLSDSSWEAGPFTYSVSTPGPVTERFVGERRVYRLGDETHVIDGPWEVVIRGLGSHLHRTVLGRWETYRSWVTEEGLERTEQGPHALAPGSSERVGGASERRWIGASEERLAGSSEAFYLGASEKRYRGASERLYRGASERLMRGASERRLGGASEQRRGASERRLADDGKRRYPPRSE